ncbi:MAG TPA: biotin carboxylase N-terminal domain-containing protein, partial [Myxococcota bacterium]|nr:biotin carboxylase N-terminal domain-containing protein [Myxococcota bacterium]
MFRRLLVANRGEVAARVVRTCRRMGITPVVLASDADASAQWLAEVEVARLPGSAPRDTYLDMDLVIAAAKKHACSALHPGWGFLAENALFAARCASEGIRFVGPSPAAMRRLLRSPTIGEPMS